jgi:hypothetical protein
VAEPPIQLIGRHYSARRPARCGGLEPGSSGASRPQVFGAQVVGISGSAQVRLNAGHAEFVVHHLTPRPAGEIYEVWLARPDRMPQPTSALFTVTVSGTPPLT